MKHHMLQDINWHYTLAQWVIYYFSDKYIAEVKSSGDQPRGFVSQNTSKLGFVGRIGRKLRAVEKLTPFQRSTQGAKLNHDLYRTVSTYRDILVFSLWWMILDDDCHSASLHHIKK
jgi:hypothetical protein